MRELNQIEVTKILGINAVNEKKDFIQELIINELRKNPKGVATLYTGFGKNYLVAKLFKFVNEKNPDTQIDFVTNSTAIVDDFKKNYIDEWELKNVNCYVINSYCKLESTSSKVVVFDEVDTMLNGKKFSNGFNVAKTAIVHLNLTATLKPSEERRLVNMGFKLIFNLSIDQAYDLGLIPEYKKFNLPIKLTVSERAAYVKQQEKYDACLAMFSEVDPINPESLIYSIVSEYSSKKSIIRTRVANILEIPPASVLVMALNWQKATQERNRILNNSENSILTTIEIAKKFKTKTIIFCANIEVAEKIGELLENCVVYHSKRTIVERKASLEKFTIDPNVKYIATVKALNRGKDIPAVENGIQQGFDSTTNSSAQRFGRVARWDSNNPNKVAKLVSIYAEDFSYQDVRWKSQQLVWLIRSQKNQSNIFWINSIDEIFLEEYD